MKLTIAEAKQILEVIYELSRICADESEYEAYREHIVRVTTPLEKFAFKDRISI